MIRMLAGFPLLGLLLLAFAWGFQPSEAQVPLCEVGPGTVTPCPTAVPTATPVPATPIPPVPPQIRLAQASACDSTIRADFLYSNTAWQLITTRNDFVVDVEPYMFVPTIGFYVDPLPVPGSYYKVFAVPVGTPLIMLPGTPYNVGQPVAQFGVFGVIPCITATPSPPVQAAVSTVIPTAQPALPTVVAAAVQQAVAALPQVRPPNTGDGGLLR